MDNISPVRLAQALRRQSFYAFLQDAFPVVHGEKKILPNWHIELIAQHLEDCAHGRTKRLLITMPPRNLKSFCASIAFPAWLLGHKPSSQVISVSYAQELAISLSLDCRRLMDSAYYKSLFPHVRISSTKDTQAEFRTVQSGYRLATSTGGTLTGRGGDFIIIDDPIKPQEALSDTLREGVNEWYDNTLYSRLNSKQEGCIIVIMQRLHTDDLVAHLLEQEDWVHLNLPAIAEEEQIHEISRFSGVNKSVYRQSGDVLHPEREPSSALKQIQKTMGTYNFSAQYQQSPVPMGGGIIKWKWFNLYDRLPNEEPWYILQSWDTASKTGASNDYSVCTTWFCIKNNYYLADVYRGRLEFNDLVKKAIELHSQYKPNRVIIEDKGSGTALLQELQKKVGIYTSAANPKFDKFTRVIAQTPCLESGRVFVPKTAEWVEDFKKEVMRFPKSKFDDQVDSLSQALEELDSLHYEAKPFDFGLNGSDEGLDLFQREY